MSLSISSGRLRLAQLPDLPGEGMTYAQAQYRAQCPIHGEWVTFPISYLAIINAYNPREVVVERKALQVIELNCGGCIKEANAVKLPPTRWPEGAEL
jgi:hypothetical protein